MKTRTFPILALLATLSGCQAISQHNAQTRSDLAAGRAAAAQAKIIAAQVREAVKGITPTKKPAP